MSFTRLYHRSWVDVLLAGGSGVLYALSFPPAALSALGWVALTPLFAAVLRAAPGRAFLLGVLFSLCAGVGVGGFLAGTVSQFFGFPEGLGWLAFGGVMALIAPLYGAYAAWLSWLERRRRASIWLAAAGWGLCEAGRSQLGVIGSWALVAYSQVPNAHVIQVLDLVGPYGLGMLMAASGFALATCLGREIRSRGVAAPALAVAAAVAAVFGYGQCRLAQSFATGAPLSVALVQSGLGREVRRDPTREDANLLHHIELTSTVADAHPDIIVWPEYAVDFYLREDTPERRLLFERARRWDADLVVGGPHYHSRFSPPHYYNSAFLIRDGRFGGRYDKLELLPFAESNPFPNLLPREVHYTPGDRARPLDARVPIGAFLCSEVLDPSLARRLSLAGAQILANPASDDWFLDPAPSQILRDTAAARAIENRRYLLRTTELGHSAIIDPHGMITAAAPGGRGAAVVVGEVAASDTTTLYQRLGDLPVWLALALVPATTLRIRGCVGSQALEDEG
jgi:apolipoprotein N-acyltransferase